jgi:hypothetical protein
MGFFNTSCPAVYQPKQRKAGKQDTYPKAGVQKYRLMPEKNHIL